MDELEARRILGEWIQPDGSLQHLPQGEEPANPFVLWLPESPQTMTLDSTIDVHTHFTVDELEALVWWMRQQGTQASPEHPC